MKKNLILCILFIFSYSYLYSQVTIGSAFSPRKGALLDLKQEDKLDANSSKGLLLPRMELYRTTSMVPIFKDSELTDELKKSHNGLMIYNLKEDYANDLCKGVYVWIDSYKWVRLPEPCCLPITGIEIANTIYHFMEGDTPTFLAEVEPLESSGPITYEWFIDDTAIPSSNNNILSIPMDISLNGKSIMVTAYNDCSKEIVASPKITLSIDALCKSVTSVSISNTDLSFIDGELVEFTANISPSDATSPVVFDWFIDGKLVKSVTDDNTVFLSMLSSYNNKNIKVKVSSCDQVVVESDAKTLSVCNPLKSINIQNSLYNKKFEFVENKEIEFTPIIMPENATGLFTYKWEFDNTLVGSDPDYTRIMQRDDNGKKLKLTVTDGCSNTSQSSEVIISIIECPNADNARVKYTGIGGSQTNKESWDFVITEFENYTGEQLNKLGVKIKWYITDVFYTNPPELKEITATDNEPHFTFKAIDFGYGDQTICLIAFSIEGAEGLMNCPMSSTKSDGFYRLTITGGGTAPEPEYRLGDWVVDPTQ